MRAVHGDDAQEQLLDKEFFVVRAHDAYEQLVEDPILCRDPTSPNIFRHCPTPFFVIAQQVLPATLTYCPSH